MDEIIEKLCKKYNMSKIAIKAVIESPLRFIVEDIRKKEFKNYSLPFLGKIYLKLRIKKDLQRHLTNFDNYHANKHAMKELAKQSENNEFKS